MPTSEPPADDGGFDLLLTRFLRDLREGGGHEGLLYSVVVSVLGSEHAGATGVAAKLARARLGALPGAGTDVESGRQGPGCAGRARIQTRRGAAVPNRRPISRVFTDGWT